jgi:hypothetical protein
MTLLAYPRLGIPPVDFPILNLTVFSLDDVLLIYGAESPQVPGLDRLGMHRPERLSPSASSFDPPAPTR